MRRKLFYGLTLLLASASVVGLTACGDKKTTDVKGVCPGNATDYQKDLSDLVPKKTTIKLWADNGQEYADELIKQFEAANPQYIVTYEKVGSTEARARMELDGASGGDVFVFPHDHVGAALATGLLAKAPTATQEKFVSTLKTSTLDTITSCWDDATNSQKKCGEKDTPIAFGAPLSAESNALFYNLKLVKSILNDEEGILKAAGASDALLTELSGKALQLNNENLSSLFTFEEIMEVAKYYNNIATGAEARYFYQADFDNFYHTYMYMTPFGYELFGPSHDDKAKANLDSAEAKASYTYLQGLLGYQDETPHSIYPAAASIVEGTYMSEFYAKTAPIVVTGPWNAQEIYKQFAAPDGEEGYPDLGGSSMPTINGKNSRTFSGVQIAAVSNFSKVTGDAWKLVEFMVSDKGASILYSTSGKLPCLNDTAGIEGISEDIVLKAVSAQLSYSDGMPSISEMGFMWDCGANLFIKLFNGEDVTEATKSAQDAFNKLANIGN